MIISLIAAVSDNNVIGKDNDLIWHQPADMKYFQQKTLGHCVLMGRKNFESIPEKYRPLSNRTNIVVTRNSKLSYPRAHFVSNLEEGIEFAKATGEIELFIIGGGEIYKQSIDLADKLYITKIHHDFDGDTFFPEIIPSRWIETNRNFRDADDKNPYDMTFLEYSKQ